MAEITQVFADREVPHSQEAEYSVVGAVLLDSMSIATAAEIVSGKDFYFDANREIFEAALELFNENLPIDIVTVSDRLQKRDRLDAVGGMPYLVNATVNVPATGNVGYYSKIIKSKAVLRRLINASNVISELAYTDSEEIEDILERSEEEIFKVSQQNENSDIVPISEVLLETYQGMVESSKSDSMLTGHSTGFNYLDRKTGGLRGGELILIAGRPGMGKSSFAVNIAEFMAITKNIPVAIFNLEMPKEMIVRRILCSQARINSEKMLKGSFDAEDWRSLGMVLDKVDAAPIYIDDSATIKVSEIRAKCRRLKQTKNLGLVVIDYLQLMQSDKKSDNRQNEVADISRSLKILAKELDVPVIALSQLSRAAETRTNKRPILSDIRESGSIEQDCDLVMFLYRDDYYNKDTEEKGIAECIIAKNRSGETATIKLGWQGQFTKFVNIEYNVKEQDDE